ncbi:MAG: heme-copper oxidase subunit III [Chloroflexi bacterium]|nr:heme-copper oxidase subunit III [Chloroflexota bacterium]
MAIATRAPAHAIAPAPEQAVRHRSRLNINRLGLWLFIASDAVFFGALLSSRYYLQGVHTPAEVSQPLGLAITVVLLLSSVSAYRGETCAVHKDQKGFRRNILFTILLGVLFLGGVAMEWTFAFEHFPPHTGFGTILFVTTGLHAFHVITGLIALVVVFRLGRDGRFSHGNFWPVEGAVKYWHFVDVAWMFIFPTLYLVG